MFNNLLVWNYMAQSFHIWYIASSRRLEPLRGICPNSKEWSLGSPLPNLFKCFDWLHNKVKRSKTSFSNCIFIRPFKNGTYHGNTWGRRAASTGFPLSKSKSFYQVFIKLGEYVGGHNISIKFYNQPNPHQALLNYGPWIIQKMN